MKGYELLELLGRGHACETYDAWSHERGCRVVVRIPRPGHRRAVLREGRLLMRLSHPHVVRAYEAGWSGVVLETLGGATLGALGRLDEDDALELGRQLCSAVGYLHGRGWLHLDLKPDNLIAEAGRLKVIDLSIAQRPGRILPETGTRGFMAPEQERGGAVGPAADVWGIGAVLRAAGHPDLAPGAQHPDPARRPSVDALLRSLRGARPRPPHPQPAP